MSILLTDDDFLEIVISNSSSLNSKGEKKHIKLQNVIDLLLTHPWTTQRSQHRFLAITTLCNHNENIKIEAIPLKEQRLNACLFSEESSDKSLIRFACCQTNLATKEICSSSWFIIHNRYLPFIIAITWIASIEYRLEQNNQNQNELKHLNQSIKYIHAFLKKHE